MGNKAIAIDEYISKSADFAKPILIHLRELVHKTCPEVEEKMKWSFPHFDYKNEMICSMAAFKQHAVFGFWKASLMKDPVLVENAKSEVAMGHLGKITSIKALPSEKKIKSWIKEAMQLNEKGIKLPAKRNTTAQMELQVPDYFLKSLNKNKQALKNFETFSYYHKKEYVTWITAAKTAVTRDKRIATAIEWLAEGKSSNWKYAAKKK